MPVPQTSEGKNHDPRQHFHGYAIVRGGTQYPFEGETFDVVGVEVKRPDGAIAGPYVGGGGLPRRRNAVKVTAGDVITITPKYPKPSDVYRILRERAAMKARAEPMTPPRRRVAPGLARDLLGSTCWRAAALWKLRRRANQSVPPVTPAMLAKTAAKLRQHEGENVEKTPLLKPGAMGPTKSPRIVSAEEIGLPRRSGERFPPDLRLAPLIGDTVTITHTDGHVTQATVTAVHGKVIHDL